MRSWAAGNAAIMTLLLPALAAATDYDVSQKGKKFTPQIIEAKVGDSLIIHNDDKVGHTAFSDTPGFEFTIGKQRPGEEDAIELDKAGEFEVRCAIHPRMRLTVVVTE